MSYSLPTNRPLNILAIDGGAMMGVIPTRILQYLEGSPANSYTYNGYNAGAATPPSLLNNPITPFGEQICDAFDLIVGTSTGGLVTMALTVPPGIKGSTEASLPTTPMTAQAVLDFYYAQGQNIFPTTTQSIFTASGPLFNNQGLIDAITSVFGAPTNGSTPLITSSTGNHPTSPASTLRTFNNVVTPTLLTSFNNNLSQTASPNVQVASAINNTSTPQGPLLLGAAGSTLTQDNWNNPLSIIEGALMTSAFPMLLPPVPYDLNFSGDAKAQPTAINYFLDGGIFAGSPALAAWFWAISQNYQVGTLVSIGCGSYMTPSTALNTYNPVATWGSGTSEIACNYLYNYEQETTNQKVKDLIGLLLDVMPSNPGWFDSQQSYKDGDYSALMHAMQTGSGQFNDLMLAAIIGNQTFGPNKNPGKFYRLQPVLSTNTNPAWTSDSATLNDWVGDTDTWVGKNAAILNSIVTQVNTIKSL